jgi:alkylation response protein AidB-like acyl-CoA dehydrogenase
VALVLTQDEELLVGAVRGLLNREAPLSAFRGLRDSGDPLSYDLALLRRLAASGFVAPNVAVADGGLGMGATAAGLIMEQAGHVLAAAPLLTASMAACLIGKTADAARKGTLLPPVVAGERIIAPALDEAARHDPQTLQTTAAWNGKEWVVTGRKTAVIDGFGAHDYLVSAECQGKPALFLAEPEAPGLEVVRFTSLDSRNYARLSLTATPAIRLDHGDAGVAIAAALDLGRALLAAELLGICDEAFDRTVAYLKERRQFDRVIGSFQALQHRAARLFARLDLARGIVLAALRAIDHDGADATWLASLSKAVLTRLSRELLIEAVQMHGGIGVTDAFDIGLFVKRARAAGDLLGDDYFHTERLARDYWHI